MHLIQMATRNGNKIKDNFLTCSICFETNADPCTLTCHHTFCQRCITKYIQTRPDAVQSKTIPCACCGQDTMVPHPSRPVEEWAGQIKPSIILQKLTNKPVLTNNCCTICQQLGEITAGVLRCPECEVDLCERCVKIHWVSPMSSNHDLFDLQTRDKGGESKSDKPIPQRETADHNNQGKGNLKAPLLVNTIDTYRISGKMSFNIRDVAVLVVDGVQTVVVTDGDNHCITSFYTRKKTPRFSTGRVKQSPWGVTQLKEKQVLVAVPESCEIVTVGVSPDLVLLSTITTRTGYYSLAVLSPSSLAASTDYCVDILDMSGLVLRSVNAYNNMRLFTYPDYICVNNKGNILVSDWGEKSVTCLTSEGDVVWSYVPTGDRALGVPHGISTARTGDILLVESNSNKVIQLTKTGVFVKDLLTSDGNVSGLKSIFCHTRESFFICCNAEVKEYKCSQY
ncbi:uncharacterized protein [Haliotis cracherodii]|uniref:uncharacterized protein isoform X1 n=2 Tax=Haliotis cracherodii TaxID=6455 RepID=UPI0039ED16CD